MKKEIGITLIALVITIIVLLILAGVSISLIIGNNGILNKVTNSVTDHEEATVAEQIKLAYAAYETAKAEGTTETATNYIRNQLKESLGLNNNEIEVTENNGQIITKMPDGKTYIYSVSSGDFLIDEPVKWSKIDNETYTNGKELIATGDYVNYDPTAGATEEDMTYISYANNSGYRSNQSFDARTYKNAGYRWRFLDIKDGKIRLISEEYIGEGSYTDSNRTKYSLKGTTGYANAINELNAISGIFGHGRGAESAISITADDINAITGYNPNSPKFNQGEWDEFGNVVTYTINRQSNYWYIF